VAFDPAAVAVAVAAEQPAEGEMVEDADIDAGTSAGQHERCHLGSKFSFVQSHL
jgi:hypothetical protein